MGLKPVTGPTYTREEFEKLRGSNPSAPSTSTPAASTGQLKPVAGPTFTPEEFQQYKSRVDSINASPSQEDLMDMQVNNMTPEEIAQRELDIFRQQNPTQTVTDIEKQRNMYSWPAQVGTGVLKGVANAGRNAIEFGTGVVDAAAAAWTYGTSALAHETGLSDTKPLVATPELTEKFNETVPELEYDGLTENVAGTLTETGIGMKAGDKGAKILQGPKSNTMGGRVNQYGGRFLGQEAGATITQSDDDTALLGNVIGIDPNDPEGIKVLKQKANILNESVLIGLGLGTVAKPVVEGAKYFNNMVPRALKDWTSLDAHKQAFVKDLIDISGKSPEEVIKFIEDNKKTVIELNDTLVKDIEINRDTVGSILKGLDPDDPNNAIAIDVLEGLRSSTIKGGSAQLTNKLKAPARHLEKKTEEVFDSRGGFESVDQGTTNIQDIADAELIPSRTAANKAKDDLVVAEQGIEAEMARNPEFQSIVQKSPGSGVNIDYSKAKDDASDAMQDRLATVSDQVTNQKNKRFKKVFDLAKGVAPNQKLIDAAIEELGYDLPADVMERFTKARGSYGELYQFANFDLPKIRETLRLEAKRTGLNTGDSYTQADRVAQLKDRLLDDQMEWLATAERGTDGRYRGKHPEIAQASEDAYKYYKQITVPMLRDGPVGKMQDNRWYKPPKEAKTANRGLLEGTLDNRSNREHTQTIVKALGKDKTLAKDYVFAKAATAIRREVNETGSLSHESYKRLLDQFDQDIPTLRAADPKAVDNLNTLLTNLRDKNFDKKAAFEKLDELEKEAQRIEHVVYGEQFDTFFKPSLGPLAHKPTNSYKRTTNSFDSMVGLLRKGKLRKLLIKSSSLTTK